MWKSLKKLCESVKNKVREKLSGVVRVKSRRSFSVPFASFLIMDIII